jgi:hypothetical protein
MKTTFNTTLRKALTKQASGIVVPEDILLSLGAGKRPAVKVTLGGYTYRSTVGKMDELYMISFSSEHRTKSGLNGDETLDVTLELDTEPRTVSPPQDLKEALESVNLLAAFESSAPSHQKEFVRQVADAKTVETRQRRIAKVIEALSSKK